MRMSAAGAVFVAFVMVAAAIGIIASHVLLPGFARLTGDETRATTTGAITPHIPLLRGD